MFLRVRFFASRRDTASYKFSQPFIKTFSNLYSISDCYSVTSLFTILNNRKAALYKEIAKKMQKQEEV
jgi:hypothetical protein